MDVGVNVANLTAFTPFTPCAAIVGPTFILLAAVKDSAEKDMFFKKLPAMIPAIPEPVAVRKFLPLLSKSLEFGGAPPSAVSSLLLIGR